MNNKINKDEIEIEIYRLAEKAGFKVLLFTPDIFEDYWDTDEDGELTSEDSETLCEWAYDQSCDELTYLVQDCVNRMQEYKSKNK